MAKRKGSGSSGMTLQFTKASSVSSLASSRTRSRKICPARDGSPMGETPMSSRGCGIDTSTSRGALFHRRRSLVIKAERAREP